MDLEVIPSVNAIVSNSMLPAPPQASSQPGAFNDISSTTNRIMRLSRSISIVPDCSWITVQLAVLEKHPCGKTVALILSGQHQSLIQTLPLSSITEIYSFCVIGVIILCAYLVNSGELICLLFSSDFCIVSLNLPIFSFLCSYLSCIFFFISAMIFNSLFYNGTKSKNDTKTKTYP